MESARLAYVSGETHVWNLPTGRAQNWQRPGHDKGPSEWAIDWPHCEGKLKYGIPGPGDTHVWHHPDFLPLHCSSANFHQSVDWVINVLLWQTRMSDTFGIIHQSADWVVTTYHPSVDWVVSTSSSLGYIHLSGRYSVNTGQGFHQSFTGIFHQSFTGLFHQSFTGILHQSFTGLFHQSLTGIFHQF